MSSGYTNGCFILFSGTNQPVGYYNGTNVEIVPSSGLPYSQNYKMFYIGQSNTNLNFLLGLNTSVTNLYDWNSTDNVIESVGTIIYPPPSSIFKSVSSINNNYVVVCGNGNIYYYSQLNFNSTPQQCLLNDPLLYAYQSQVTPYGANNLSILQDGNLYAFGNFLGIDGITTYSSIFSSDGIRWNVVQNTKNNPNINTVSSFTTGISGVDSNNNPTNQIILGGCQTQSYQPQGCAVSCVADLSSPPSNPENICVQQNVQSNRIIPSESSPNISTSLSITNIWYASLSDASGYYASIQDPNTTNYGAAYSGFSGGKLWRLLYSNSLPVTIQGLNYNIVANYSYSPILNQIVTIGLNTSASPNTYSVLYSTSLLTPNWSAIPIPSSFGTPYAVYTLPSEQLGSSSGSVKQADIKKKGFFSNLWTNYRNAVIFSIVGLVFYLLNSYANFVNSLRAQQAQIAALSAKK